MSLLNVLRMTSKNKHMLETLSAMTIGLSMNSPTIL